MGAGHTWRRRWVLCLLGCCLTVLAGGCGLVNRATDWIGLGKPETTPEFKAPISTRVSTATPTPSPSMTLESSSETSEATATRVSATRLPTATRTATVTPTPTFSLLMGPAATLVEQQRRTYTALPKHLEPTPLDQQDGSDVPAKSTLEAAPTWTPAPIETPDRPTLFPTASGGEGTPAPSGSTIVVNHWRYVISQVLADVASDPALQSAVLLGQVTNEGQSTDSFSPRDLFLLRDANSSTYAMDAVATSAATARYGAESPDGITADGRRYVAVAFNVPASVHSFTIVAGPLAASWGGNIAIVLP